MGTACVPEEGGPNRAVTQAHRSKSAPKQPTNAGKGEGSRTGERRECEGRQAGAQIKEKERGKVAFKIQFTSSPSEDFGSRVISFIGST